MGNRVIIVGSGNAALCAGISALEHGSSVLMLEKAPESLSGGNTKYTAGAMRFSYDSGDDLLPLLSDCSDSRLPLTDFGSYPLSRFESDLLSFNDGLPLSPEQRLLISDSYDVVRWLSGHGVYFEPIYSRQSFGRDGRHIFWGGLTLGAVGEGVGLHEMELHAYESLGGEIRYDSGVTSLLLSDGNVRGVCVGSESYECDSVILGCGGFESNESLRVEHLGPDWSYAKVRGTPHNTGDGLALAQSAGACLHGRLDGCHATPMDLHMPDFGDLSLPAIERKRHRKLCYFLGVMLNSSGRRFVDEGSNFRNYTYAQFGGLILSQPGHFAWQIFDSRVFGLLYDEYHFGAASYVESDTLEGLVSQLSGVDSAEALRTLRDYNSSIDDSAYFDPSILDGRCTVGLDVPKTNWALGIEVPPFRGYPVTGGITFTYGGLRVNEHGCVLRSDGSVISGLFACGELVGGVFYGGYPGGSGLTSGSVFGRRAGIGASSGASS